MTQSTTHLLIAGSRDATPQMLNYTRQAVRRAQERGYTVIVGDNPKGVDMAVVRECRRLKTPVIVAGPGNFPRNGGCKHGSYVKVHRDDYRGVPEPNRTSPFPECAISPINSLPSSR